MRAVLAALVVLAVAVSNWPSAADAAEVVRTRAWAHDGYGRIVFDWSSPVGFNARISGQALAVSFDREMIPSFVSVLEHLSAYVTTASLSGDGRTVTFGLTRPFTPRSFASGNAVVIDLLEPGPDAPPPPPALVLAPEPELAPLPAAAPSPTAAPAVTVRFGRHPGYTRVVFDWPQAVDYRIDRDGNSTRIRFGRDATVDEAELRNRLLNPFESAAVRREDGALTVVFGIPANAGLRDFRDGDKVVIDVLAPAEPRQAQTEAEALPEPIALVVPPPQVARPDFTPSPAAAEPPAELEEPAPEPEVAAPEPEPEPEPAEAVAAAPQIPDDAVRVAATSTDDGFALRFEWDYPVAAAVFERAGFLWAAFDAPRALDLSDLGTLGQAVSQADQLTMVPAAALRMRLAEGLRPEVSRDGHVWVVNLTRTPARPQPIAVIPEIDSPTGARIALPVAEAGSHLTLVDPEVGDELIVVPVPQPGHGVTPSRRYVDLEVLETAQGVAVRPISDLISVRSLRNQIEVTSLEGLSLSEPLAMRRPPAPVEEEEDLDPSVRERARAAALLASLEEAGRDIAGQALFDLAGWQRGGLETFTANKHQLNLEIAQATDQQRDHSLLAMAEFLFANGFTAEALGIINLVTAGDGPAAGLPRLKALRGAANAVMGRHAEAAADLSHRRFDNNPEIALWRGAVAFETGDIERAIDEFARSRGIVERYPPIHRLPLLLMMAEAALAGEDVFAAERIVDHILAADPPVGQRDYAQYLRAGALAAGGRPLDALDLYDELAHSADRLVRARTGYAGIELQLAEDMINIETAVEEMERLRFAWRGDDFELALMQRLGDLHAEIGNWQQALGIWRDAVSNFPDSPTVREIAKSLNDTFLRLFVDGVADALPPIQALALYYEFRELTPVGSLGDELVHRLADRLVSVDLLEQAAALLQHQVNFRLRDTELARVGSRLAAIYLLDREPDRAVEALRSSDIVAMPEDLARDRRYLMVRALSETGAAEEALALLQGDGSRDADFLRADIFWDQEDWLAVATVIDRIFRDREDDEPLSEDEGQYLMKLVVALALSNNREALTRIRDRYTPLVADTGTADAFRAITSYVSGEPVDPRDLTRTVADINNYEAFMAGLRARVNQDSLSAIN